MTPLILAYACLHCGQELRFDPWLEKWVDRHHADKVSAMRKNAPGGPHHHRPFLPTERTD